MLRQQLFDDLAWYGMEGFAADPHRNSLEVSLAALDKCELYVGVLGPRYGSTPPDNNASYVEVEYNLAVAREMPRLLFLMELGCDEWQHCGEEPDQEKGDKLARLRARFEKDRLLKHFDSPGDLAAKVVLALLSPLVTERDRKNTDINPMLVSSAPPARKAAEIVLTASPAVVVADGVTGARVTATVTDADGNAVHDGEPVRWQVLGGAIANPANSETDGGQASTIVTPLSNLKEGRLAVAAIAPRSGVSNSVYIDCIPTRQPEEGAENVAGRREGEVGIDIQPRVAGEWALLDVKNTGLRKAMVRAKGKILHGSKKTEEPYSIRWRESVEPAIPIDASGGHEILNVVSASMPKFPQGGMRYTDFEFHTARLPVGQGNISESFRRIQETYAGFVLEVVVTSDPPLPTPIKKYYALRAADEPDWMLLSEVIEKGDKASSSPKIEFREIDGLQAASFGELAEYTRHTDSIENQQNRPRFAVTEVASNRLEQQFTPVFRVQQLPGPPIAALQWRFRGPRFKMNWEQVSGGALGRRHFLGTFDLRQPPQSDDQVGLDEIGLEIRFPWQGGWAHELHRWGILRHEFPDKALWDLNTEVLPPKEWFESA